jgi:hypothetical protein
MQNEQPISELMERRQEFIRQLRADNPRTLGFKTKPRRYRASRGGHAPGHLRDALIECLDQEMTGQVGSWVDAMADDEALWFYNPTKQRRMGENVRNEPFKMAPWPIVELYGHHWFLAV